MKFNAIMIAIFIAITGYSQGNSVDSCARNKGLYYQHLKIGNFIDARDFWLQALDHCGGTSAVDSNFFINGRAIYYGLRKQLTEVDSLRLSEINDTIDWVYNNLLVKTDNPERKLEYAGFLYASKSKDYMKLDSLFSSVHELKSTANPKYFKLYFKHLIMNNFNHADAASKDAIRAEIANVYFALMKYCKSANSNKTGYQEAEKFMTKYFVQVIPECEMIETHLTEHFDHLPLDSTERYTELNEMMELMDKITCTSTGIYSTYIYELVRLKPSASGYAGIGKIEMNNSDFDAAIDAFKKAIELEESDSSGDYHYQLAVAYYKSGAFKSAFYAAKKVNGDYQGKAAIICAQSIAELAQVSGNSSFERDANYWLASDYLERAVKLGEEINSSKYDRFWPTQEEGFEYSVNSGDNWTCAYWGESTMVRF